MSTFDESVHPRGQAANAGQFAAKMNSAPTGALVAPGATLEAILRERATAASIHLSARNSYFLANRDAATAVLREQFPGAEIAIFTRNWDEDQVKLHQVLGATDIDFTEDDDWGKLTPEQREARRNAQVWVQEMGDQVPDYIDPSDEEHDGWYEYQLDLTQQPPFTDAARYTIEQLEPGERSALDAALSDHDGRAISTFDTTEIAYQLQEGYWAEADDLNFAGKLTERYGTIEKAAAAIADSTEWSELRDDVDTYARQRMLDEIGRASVRLIHEEDTK